jgi:hypothetical protein
VIAKVVIQELKRLLETIRRNTDLQAREAAAVAQGALARLHKLKAQASALYQLGKPKSAPKARGTAKVTGSI